MKHPAPTTPPSELAPKIYRPPCDSWETDTHRTYCLDLPGMLVSDIRVEIVGGHLLVSGTRSDQQLENASRLESFECQHGHFERDLPLPCAVNPNEITARYHEGVLEIVVPKRHPSERFQVKVEEGPHLLARAGLAPPTDDDQDRDDDIDCDCLL